MAVNGRASRKLTVRQAAFIGVGATVGAGIFSLLGAAGEGCRHGRLAVVPDRGRDRPAAGILLRQVRRPLPLGGRPARVRRAGTRQRPPHRHHRVADPGRQRHRHRHGRGLVRKLCQRRPHRRQHRVDQGLRGAAGAGHDPPEHPRFAGGSQDPDGHRLRRAHHPHAVCGHHACQPGRSPARVLRLPPAPRHRLQRRADLLCLPWLWRGHVHRQGPRQPLTAVASRHLPRAGDRDHHLRRGCAGCVRHAHGREGDLLGRHRPGSCRGARAGPGRLLAHERHGAVFDRWRDERGAVSLGGVVRGNGVDRSVPAGAGSQVRGGGHRWGC